MTKNELDEDGEGFHPSDDEERARGGRHITADLLAAIESFSASVHAKERAQEEERQSRARAADERKREARPFAEKIIAWARALEETGALKDLPSTIPVFHGGSGRDHLILGIERDGSVWVSQGNYMGSGSRTYANTEELSSVSPGKLQEIWAHLESGGATAAIRSSTERQRS